MGSPATYGTLKEFNPETERISTYLERMALFLQANKVADADQVPVFLSIIGGKVYSLLRDLLAPALPQDSTYATLVETLTKHYEPRPIVIAERFHFHKRNQASGESIAEYVAELRRLAAHCKFEGHLEEALRDRLVCGLRHDGAQKKLLSEADLTLNRAVEIAQGMEAADKTSMGMKQQGEPIHYASSGDRKSPCYRCGRTNHTADDCRFKQATCHHCGKKGHISPACKSKSQDQDPRAKQKFKRKKPRQRSQRTGWVAQEEDTSDSSPENQSNLPIYCLQNSRSKPIVVSVMVNGKPLQMEVDTGAALSLISGATKEALFPKEPLQTSQILLQTYTGQPMDVLGEFRVTVRYRRQSKSLVLVVVGGNGPSLFGRNWLEHIQLDWKTIGAVAVDQKATPKIDELCSRYEEIFRDELGTISSFTARLEVDTKAKPKFFKARPTPYSTRDPVGQELERMETEGILERVDHSEWATPIVAVPKSEGRFRICGDFSVTINPVIAVDQYPLPKPQDLYATLAGGQHFTTLDLNRAYLQLNLDEESQKLVVVNTHKGLYKFKRLPFGVASAPAVFQKVMDSILRDIPGVICYIDDIMVTGKTDEEHLCNLERVFQRLQKHGIRLNRKKCKFMQKSVKYLGLVVDAEGLHASTDKIEAVIDAPKPTDIRELRSFLGMMNYYRKFIPNLATILKPLTDLLQHNTRWCWSDDCAAAFKEAKNLLTKSPVLVHYDPTLPIRMAADASSHGIGAVLSHVLPSGEEKPIAYASRTLSSAERNYAQIEKEALGIVFGIRKYHQYLYGRRFTLITDHKPLTTILGPKRGVPAVAAARLQRWAIQLSAYDYEIEFRATDEHANADGLSRLPLKKVGPEEGAEVRRFQTHQIETLFITADHIRKATKSDKVLGKVLHYSQHGWPSSPPKELQPYYTRRNEISVESQCLLWGIRVIIPTPLREQLLCELHQDHPGISRMKSLARGHLWWPGLDGDIEKVAKGCKSCHEAKQAPPKSPLHPWIWPSKSWQRVHIDFAGPFMGKSFFLAVDAHSKWGEVHEMTSTTTTKTIEVLRRMFASYGLPQQLVSDNGPQFISQEFADFMKGNRIRHIRSAPYHPSSNGEAERFVRTFKESMKASRYDGLPFTHRLQSFLLSYRSTPHSTTNVAPCELFLGRKLRTKLDLLRPDVEDHVIQKQMKQKSQHDMHSRFREFHIGQQVMARNMRSGPAWIPGKVIQRLGPVTYLIDVYGDRPWKCHIDQLKEYVADSDPATPRSPGPRQLETDDVGNSEYDITSEVPLATGAAAPAIGLPLPPVSEPAVSLPSPETRRLPDATQQTADPPPDLATPVQSQTGHAYPLRDRARHKRTL